MCVTSDLAFIEGTRTYVYATRLNSKPVHVCGYQNQAMSVEGPNCMFLNFAGSNLQLVRGPERTRSFMEDMTAALPELAYADRGMRSGSYGRGITVESYGDYTVILAQGPGDILSALNQVPANRRPARNRQLQEMVNFYMSWFGRDSFVLACFDGRVQPQHPITVSYTPRDRSVLTIPGLDGHDGTVPTIGEPVYRDFRLAFGVEGVQLPINVYYNDKGVLGQPWAPSSVTGFTDNRSDGPNGDYVVPVKAVWRGLMGAQLAAALR